MLGKSKGKSKKKKGKKGDGGAIAAALMPSASIAAAPRTPPPPPAPDFQEGLGSSDALNTSLLGRMFTAPGPADDGPSETDTSLYDYENARNTMPYSTVGSVQLRGMVSPPTGFSDPDYELETGRRSSSGLRNSRDSELSEPMYATPYKTRPSSSKRKSRSPSPRDRSYTSDTAQSLRDSRTLSFQEESPEVTMRSTGRRSRSAGSNGYRTPIDIDDRPPSLPRKSSSLVSLTSLSSLSIHSPPTTMKRKSLPPSEATPISQQPTYANLANLEVEDEQETALAASAPVLASSSKKSDRGSQKSLHSSPASSTPALNENKRKSSSLKNSAKALFSKFKSTFKKRSKGSKRSSTASLDDEQSLSKDWKTASLPRNFERQVDEPPLRNKRWSENVLSSVPERVISDPVLSSGRKFSAESTGESDAAVSSRPFVKEEVVMPQSSVTVAKRKQKPRQISPVRVQQLREPGNQMPRPKTQKKSYASRIRKVGSLTLDSHQREVSMTGERSVADLSHTASIRLRLLHDQNAQLLEKQQLMEQQLTNQQQAQKVLMERLERHGLLASQNPEETTATLQDMASLMHETQSVTEKTLTKHEELHKSHQERVVLLEKEKAELTELNEQLQAEIISMRRMSSFRDHDDEGSTQTSVLKKQLQDYKDECDTLKSATQRLSSELARYQAQFRILAPSELDELPGIPSRGPKPAWLVNTKYLAPLFLAYDDHIREKDSMLQQCQKDIEHFLVEIEKVVKENHRLHIRLEQTDVTGPTGMTEWRSLQEQCKLVLEENQLLMEQLDVQQNKSRDMHRAHVQEVSVLSKRLVASEAEASELQQEVSDIKNRYTDVKKKYDEAVIENKARPGLDEHLKSVSELKRLLEDETNKHILETENNSTQLQVMAAEKKGLSLQVEELKEEKRQLESQLKSILKKQRKSDKTVEILKKSLEAAEAKELTAEHYLTSVVRMAEKTVQERDSLSRTLSDQERQHKATINKAIHGKVVVGRMEEKLKSYKLKANEKLEMAASRLKDQDDDFNRQRQEYERELKHLRLMLKERQELLEGISTEKKMVEEDLETMWQVASHDNQKMKQTVRESLSRLKNHDGLLDKMTTNDFDKDIMKTFDSDDE